MQRESFDVPLMYLSFAVMLKWTWYEYIKVIYFVFIMMFVLIWKIIMILVLIWKIYKEIKNVKEIKFLTKLINQIDCLFACTFIWLKLHEAWARKPCTCSNDAP